MTTRALRIDHLLLNATTSKSDVDALVARLRADTSPSLGIVIPPAFAKHAVEAARGSGIRIIGVAGYPLGVAKSTVKAIEATSLAKDGVDAVELTPLAANLRARDFEALRAELLEVVRGVRAARPATTTHVRLDLDILELDPNDLPALNDAITRGACDGIVLESMSPTLGQMILAAWPAGTALERKLVERKHGGDLTASARDRVTALGRPMTT